MSGETQTRPVLTIGIPTFNRADSLARQLEHLTEAIRSQRLSEVVEILVFDNASSDETPEVIKKAKKRRVRIQSHRNPVNLGCDTNYLRVVEHARGEWCWLLGDDEPVELSSLSTFVERLKTEPADALHLLLPGERGTVGEVFFTSLDSLIAHPQGFGPLQQLSTNVFRSDFARSQLIRAYGVSGKLHAYSALMLAAVSAGRGLRFYDLPLIGTATAKAPRWNFLPALLGAIETLVDATEPEHRAAMRRKATDERVRPFLLIALRDVLGIEASGLDQEAIERFLRVFPASRWPLLLPLAGAWAVRRSGALAPGAGLLERLAPQTTLVGHLRREYAKFPGETLPERINAALSQATPKHHDGY